MSCIVYQTNKKTGVKYAYESISYWDPEKKQPRSKRKYLDKVDPETGEIIYTNKIGENVAAGDVGRVQILQDQIAEKDAKIAALEKDLITLSKKYDVLLDGIIKGTAGRIRLVLLPH